MLYESTNLLGSVKVMQLCNPKSEVLLPGQFLHTALYYLLEV